MAWTASKIFSSFVTDAFNNTTAFALSGDAIKAALFDNTITPSQTVASASAAYGAGVWAGGGVTDTGTSAPAGWPSAGIALTGKSSTFASNVYTFSASNTPSANSATTLTNAFGCLVYDSTLSTPVANQALCYNWFGGGNSITTGSFTIVWNGSGIMAFTL